MNNEQIKLSLNAIIDRLTAERDEWRLCAVKNFEPLVVITMLEANGQSDPYLTDDFKRTIADRCADTNRMITEHPLKEQKNDE